jgi:hypothetical protein
MFDPKAKGGGIYKTFNIGARLPDYVCSKTRDKRGMNSHRLPKTKQSSENEFTSSTKNTPKEPKKNIGSRIHTFFSLMTSSFFSFLPVLVSHPWMLPMFFFGSVGYHTI